MKTYCFTRTITTAVALAAAVLVMGKSDAQNPSSEVAVAWWNVENLFDPHDDSLTRDDDFTPEGLNHWTPRRLNIKLQAIAKTIVMMDMPDVVGLAEVENAYVLKQLCMTTPLRLAGYSYLHHDSPDPRGIDCALLYRTECFRPVVDSAVSMSDSAEGYYTRDVLMVVGVVPSGDTLCLLLNHWPSKLGGELADQHRMVIAQRLRQLMARLRRKYPTAAVLALGDMNSSPSEPAVAIGMGFGADSLNAEGICNLTTRLPHDWGSHKYQGVWSYIDQAYFWAPCAWACTEVELIRLPHLIVEESRMPGVKPHRTYQGPRYLGGISDHLPLLLRLKCQ